MTYGQRTSPAALDRRCTPGGLKPWEAQALEAVGNVIEFWGFKRNHGRIWGLLYLREVALTAAELQEVLDLSKGGVSMLVRDLERWRVVSRQRVPGDATWRYAANGHLMEMIGRVLTERESTLLGEVVADLQAAVSAARVDPEVDGALLQRLERMHTLAVRFNDAVRAFIQTAQLDVRGVMGVLRTGLAQRLAGLGVGGGLGE